MTNLDLIQQKCIEVNPAIMEVSRIMTQEGATYTTHKLSLHRPIRLADVLLAVERSKRMPNLRSPELKRFSDFSDVKTIIDLWNLREDDLSKQSPETISFLAGPLKAEPNQPS